MFYTLPKTGISKMFLCLLKTKISLKNSFIYLSISLSITHNKMLHRPAFIKVFLGAVSFSLKVAVLPTVFQNKPIVEAYLLV